MPKTTITEAERLIIENIEEATTREELSCIASLLYALIAVVTDAKAALLE